MVLFASEVPRASIFVMQRLLADLCVQCTAEFFADMVHSQERERIVNMIYYLQLQERYLRSD
jgi:hypothetical protein